MKIFASGLINFLLFCHLRSIFLLRKKSKKKNRLCQVSLMMVYFIIQIKHTNKKIEIGNTISSFFGGGGEDANEKVT